MGMVLPIFKNFTLLTNPLRMDSDLDSISDGDESGQYSTNPLLADTDGDGYMMVLKSIMVEIL